MEVEKVSKAIAFLRKRAGYTQKDLAERLGVSDKAVSKWERGLGLPDISSLRKLSILLDTDTDSLLAGDVIHHDSGWQGVLLLDKAESGVGLQTTVYDKPLACYLLSHFLLVGIKKIYVICSAEEELYMKARFGDGSEWGISLIYCGSDIENVWDTHPSIEACSNHMIVHGRSFVFGVDQTRFYQKAMVDRDRLTVLSLPRGSKTVQRRLYFDNDKKIIFNGDNEELNTQYDYYDIPVIFCPQRLLRWVCRAVSDGSMVDNNGELEGEFMYTEVLDRGFVEMSVDNWENVLRAANFVQVVQEACGMNLYCLEEIVWRRGMISTEQLRILAEKQRNSAMKDYLLELCHNAREED